MISTVMTPIPQIFFLRCYTCLNSLTSSVQVLLFLGSFSLLSFTSDVWLNMEKLRRKIQESSQLSRLAVLTHHIESDSCLVPRRVPEMFYLFFFRIAVQTEGPLKG